MKNFITDNNPYLLIEGTDQPQRDGDGNPITNPNYGQTTEIDLPDPPTAPRVLTKTGFQDYAVSQLGCSMTGMARFQAIMDGCAAGTGAVRFCFSRYEAADTFEKSKVADFTAIMVGASIMTPDERTAMLGNWPTA